MNDDIIVEFPEIVYKKERRKIIREVGKNSYKGDRLKRIEVSSRGANRISHLPINGYNEKEDFDQR